MVAIVRDIPTTTHQHEGLDSFDRGRFMAHVIERSELSHYHAYRLSRVLDELHLGLLTQQIAAFERVAEHREATSVDDWDQALHLWIETENGERAENSTRYNAEVVFLPRPTSHIEPGRPTRH